MTFEIKTDLPKSTQNEIDRIELIASALRTTYEAAYLTSRLPYLTNKVISRDSDGNILSASGLTVPTGYSGFAKGATFIKTDASSNGLYVNIGDSTTSSWILSDTPDVIVGTMKAKSLSVQKTLTNARTNVIAVQVPNKAVLIAAVLNNDTAIAGVDDATGLTPITAFTALYSTGATQAINGSIVVANGTNTKAFFNPTAATPITTGLTDITVDAGVGNKFTAGGKITGTVYYYEL